MSDADRFEAFVRRYQDMVFATAVRLLGNQAEAEDVAQNVFLKAFQRFDVIEPNPAAPGWLKTVTRNACLTHLSRYRARWRFFSELGTGREDDGANREPDRDEAVLVSESSPAAQFDRIELRERLERALAQLPDQQRVPLVLFHFDEMSYQDIAAALGASLAKVKSDIHRGREALRRYLPDVHASR
jgi:RNA polymerase sigma-70 factor (ECF subfamily)